MKDIKKQLVLLDEAAKALVREHQAGHHLRIPTELVILGFFRVWGETKQYGYDQLWKEISGKLPRTCAKLEEWANEMGTPEETGIHNGGDNKDRGN